MPKSRLRFFEEQSFHDTPDEQEGVDLERQTALLDASRKIAMIYAGLLDSGLSEHMVAEAMLGATIHFYDAAGLTERMPDLLRNRAERIERVLLNRDQRNH